MSEKDIEPEARRRRVRLLKKLIIIVPLSMILILLLLCMLLGIRLYFVTKELRTLRSQIEKTTVIEQTDTAEDTIDTDITASSTDMEAEEPSSDAETVTDEIPKKEDGIRKVYLTFDDGPSSNTDRILDVLAEYDVKATFFVVGKEEERYQSLYKRIVEEGHTLAMHSYSHKYNEIYQSVDSYVADLSRLREFLYDTTGVWCSYCRFPGGSSNSVSKVDMHDLIAYLDEQDMTYFDWNVSSGDAASGYISPEEIIANCTGNLESFDEAIILMHDASNKNSTVEALPGLIETIRAMEDTKIVPISDETEPIHHISND